MNGMQDGWNTTQSAIYSIQIVRVIKRSVDHLALRVSHVSLHSLHRLLHDWPAATTSAWVFFFR